MRTGKNNHTIIIISIVFTKSGRFEYRELMPGVRMRPLAAGQATLLCEFLLAKGHRLPLHRHLFEQTGFLISGRLRFRIGEEWFDAVAGDSWFIPGEVLHEVEVVEESHLTEVFSPVRPDYLPEEWK